jgi:hypothetical protein
VERRGRKRSKKYAYLLAYKDVAEWYANLANKNELTADTYLRRLGWADKERHIDPIAMSSKTPKEVKSILIGLIQDMTKEKYRASYIESAVKALKSWLGHFDIEVRRLNLPNVEESEMYRDEVLPTKAEIKGILDAADLRAKVAVSVLCFAGQRPEVVGSYHGEDGLELRDFPELEYANDKKKARFQKMPSYFRVRIPISKKKHEYLAFLPEQACRYIEQYLQQRMREGEVLKPGSALVTSVWGRMKEVSHNKWEVDEAKAGQHISTTKVWLLVKNAMEAGGVNKRPYVFRRVYETQMRMNAPSEGLILPDFVDFFAGYKGPISHRYTLHKGLPDDLIENMRRQYKKAADKFLVTEKAETQDETLLKIRLPLLKFARYTDEEIRQLGDISAIPEAKFQALLGKRQNESLGLHAAGSQKPVGMSEVESYVLQGWEFVTQLPGGKAVIRRPNHISVSG